jgi:hypothetical protein
MSKHKNAADFIEDAERRAGARWDDPDNPAGLYTLLASVARAMGTNPHSERDDYVAGMSLAKQIQDELTGESARKRAADNMLVSMLTAGMPPDTLGALLGRKEDDDATTR